MEATGYCIFIHSLCEGPVPLVCDAGGTPVVFESERDAQREIVDHLMTRLQEFLDGSRDFEDAMTVEEFIVPVTVHSDGVRSEEVPRER